MQAWHRVGVRSVDGVPVSADLEALGPSPQQLTAVLAATRLAAEVGAAPAAVLDRVVVAVEREAEAEGQRAAAMAGPQATARLLAWLPLGGLLLGVGLGAEPWLVLLDGGAGTVMLALGVALMVIGHRWATRAVRGAVAAGAGEELDVAVILDLVEAACACGASVPRALEVVGRASGGRGESLAEVAAALVVGSPWSSAWSRAPASCAPVATALRSAWEEGAPPGGGLRTAAEQVRRDRHALALQAAGRLGVRLVLPLGLCHLPAFVLIGLVPLLVSMAAGSLG